MIAIQQLAKEPFMLHVENYMTKHDFLAADVCKVRKWVREAIGDRPEMVCEVTITRKRIIVKNIYGSTCEISRLALGIQENFK